MSSFFLHTVIVITLLITSFFAFPQKSKIDYIEGKPPEPTIRSKPDNKLDKLLYADGSEEDLNGFSNNLEGRLKLIANRFSPILYLNTNRSYPRNIKDHIDNLIVDKWDMSFFHPKHVTTGSKQYSVFSDVFSSDSQISNFLQDSVVFDYSYWTNKHFLDHNERANQFKIVFRYELNTTASSSPTTYVHPFIWENQNTEVDSLHKYEFVLQYWFFYPYNDSANDHEGDWEHVNILITSRPFHDNGMLKEQEIKNIIYGTNIHDDSLRIKRIDSFFHHYLVELNLLKKENNKLIIKQTGNPHLPGIEILNYTSKKTEGDTLKKEAHPVFFLGGDDISITNYFSYPSRGRDQESHGTYPWTGIWAFGPNKVARERIQRKSNINRIEFSEENIMLIPNWEYLDYSKAIVRKEWSWLKLPAFWGEPVNPFILGLDEKFKGADLGQYATFGPTFSGGWNQIGESPRFEVYNPRKLSYSEKQRDLRRFNYTPLGFTNIFLLPLHLPPINFIIPEIPGISQLLKNQPIYYPKDSESKNNYWWSEFSIAASYLNTVHKANLISSLAVAVATPNTVRELTFINFNSDLFPLVQSGKPALERNTKLGDFSSKIQDEFLEEKGYSISAGYRINSTLGLRTSFWYNNLVSAAWRFNALYKLDDEIETKFTRIEVGTQDLSTYIISTQLIWRVFPGLLRWLDLNFGTGLSYIKIGAQTSYLSVENPMLEQLFKQSGGLNSIQINDQNKLGLTFSGEIKLGFIYELISKWILKSQYKLQITPKIEGIAVTHSLNNDFGNRIWSWTFGLNFGAAIAF